MKCQECDQPVIGLPDKTRPSERTFPGYPYCQKDAFGTWLYPLIDRPEPLCWFHRKKAAGHFNRSDEYFRYNRGPNEWTTYSRPEYRTK